MTPQQDAKQTIILSWILAIVGIAILTLIIYGIVKGVNWIFIRNATPEVTKFEDYEDTSPVTYPYVSRPDEPCPKELVDIKGDCLDTK